MFSAEAQRWRVRPAQSALASLLVSQPLMMLVMSFAIKAICVFSLVEFFPACFVGNLSSLEVNVTDTSTQLETTTQTTTTDLPSV